MSEPTTTASMEIRLRLDVAHISALSKVSMAMKMDDPSRAAIDDIAYTAMSEAMETSAVTPDDLSWKLHNLSAEIGGRGLDELEVITELPRWAAILIEDLRRICLS